ncbi:MAG: sugar transferase [Opitutales bacterium]|nr:sugar transferase [Opitutales bacterium]MCH8539781.1 sugar transferase [Opitutales bacterium]
MTAPVPSLLSFKHPGFSRWHRLWATQRAHLDRWWCRLRRATDGAVKRIFDIILSGAALIVIAPLWGLIALWIKKEDRGPVLFTQTRVGKFGTTFKIYKFRSMRIDAEEELGSLLSKNEHRQGVTFKLKEDPRITRVGLWLRKFSFDELPQFYNVLRGDMSLVGPRPPIPREVKAYSLADRRRLLAKPGITCLWQISGRAEIDFKRQVELDVRYIETRGFFGDLWILYKTVPAVLWGAGAY